MIAETVSVANAKGAGYVARAFESKRNRDPDLIIEGDHVTVNGATVTTATRFEIEAQEIEVNEDPDGPIELVV